MPKSPDSNESTLLELVSRYPDTRALITASRRAMKSAFPRAEETADLKAGLISYSFGPGYKGVVATLILSKAAVKIGIPFGAALDDPGGLLEGSGKVHRHIPITSIADLERPPVSKLLRATLDAWKSRSGGSVRDS